MANPRVFGGRQGAEGHNKHFLRVMTARRRFIGRFGRATSSNTTWSNTGDTQTSHFPAPDADVVPTDVTWWQVKFCGEGGDGNQSTPFSNVISFGPVPAA
jgi:hypothetical protein